MRTNQEQEGRQFDGEMENGKITIAAKSCNAAAVLNVTR